MITNRFFILPLVLSLKYSNSFINNGLGGIRVKRNLFSAFYKKKLIDSNSGTGFNMYSTGISSKVLRNLAPKYLPKTPNQELYSKFLTDSNVPVVLGVGPAGSGKTLFACITAIKELMSGNIQKIVLTRPIVAVEEEELGFLPGDINRKMDPWTRPLFDILLEFYQQKDIDLMIQSGVIEISPLAYMRGRTFKRCFIIADEMQNSSPNQMLMLTTRLGERSKLVITGDLKQSDRSISNGLVDIMQKVRNYQSFHNNPVSMIQIVEMNHTDIRRSDVVSHILNVYDDKYSIFNGNVGVDAINSDCEKDNQIFEDSSKYDSKHFYDNDAAMIPISHIVKGVNG